MHTKRENPPDRRAKRAESRRVHLAREFFRGLETLETRRLLSSMGTLNFPIGLAGPSGVATAVEQGSPVGSPGPKSNAAWNDWGQKPTVTAGGNDTDLADTPYVIVPEIAGPHSTMAAAQVLPDLPYFGVVGTLQRGAVADMFQIGIDPSLPALQLNVQIRQPAGDPGETIWLFDAEGQTLAEWTLGGTSQANVEDMALNIANIDGAVFLGIGGPAFNSAAGGQPALGYQFWVSREEAPTSTSTDDMSAEATGQAQAPTPPVTAGPVNASTVQAASAPAAAIIALPTGAQNLVPAGPVAGPRLVATSALPALSAAPSGGLLSLGDPTFAIDSRLISPVVAPEVGEREATPPVPELAPSPEGAEANLGSTVNDGAPVVMLHGPGGFPLQVTALTKDWPGRAATDDRVLLAAALTPNGFSPHCTGVQTVEYVDEASVFGFGKYGGPVVAALSVGIVATRPELVRRAVGHLKRLVARMRVKGNPSPVIPL
jgi:hypothetical protein